MDQDYDAGLPVGQLAPKVIVTEFSTRLTNLDLVSTLERRIGRTRAGSAGHIYPSPLPVARLQASNAAVTKKSAEWQP